MYSCKGSSHLFAEEDGQEYERDAAEAMIGRVIAFLGQIAGS